MTLLIDGISIAVADEIPKCFSWFLPSPSIKQSVFFHGDSTIQVFTSLLSASDFRKLKDLPLFYDSLKIVYSNQGEVVATCFNSLLGVLL